MSSNVLTFDERASALQDRDEAATHEWPAPLDLHALAQRTPELPQHIIEEFMPAGEVTLCAGHGGGGKSLLALYVAVCVALGRSPWLSVATEQRHVTIVSAEDGTDVIHWRLARVCAYLAVPIEALAGKLDIIDVSRMDAELMIEIPHDEPRITSAYTTLSERIDPDDVLILDGASDLYGASEIVRRHVRRYIRMLRRLISPRGAVLLLAHVDKSAARDTATTDRYSGSTAWHNSVRARWSLTTDTTTGALTLTLAKANYARAGTEVRLTWDAAAHLYVPQAPSVTDGLVGSIRDRTEQRDIVRALSASVDAGIYVPAALTGPRTAYLVLRDRDEFPAALRADDRATRARFVRHLETLRRITHIADDTMRRSGRHTTAIIVPTAEGRAACANA